MIAFLFPLEIDISDSTLVLDSMSSDSFSVIFLYISVIGGSFISFVASGGGGPAGIGSSLGSQRMALS